MFDLTNINYEILDDIKSIIESERIDIETLSKLTKISKATISEIKKTNHTTKNVYEKFYSYAYQNGYRLNLVKEEFLKETYKNILFHGSKNGLGVVKADGSRKNCDFGEGFYMGETYSSAISFVCENENSCVYSFVFEPQNLNIVNFTCSLEWMLSICYFRGFLKEYENNKMLKSIIKKINEADVIIAPIADNRMFYIMSLFANGDITDNVAIHSLSASSLGRQFVLKTDKAINCLNLNERYYISQNEKMYYISHLNQRADFIETKLKLAKREFKDGKYIEEILK